MSVFESSAVIELPLIVKKSISYPWEWWIVTISSGSLKSIAFWATSTLVIEPPSSVGINLILVLSGTIRVGVWLYPLPPVVIPI